MIFIFEREGGDCAHLSLRFELYSGRSDDPEKLALLCKKCKRDVVYWRVRKDTDRP